MRDCLGEGVAEVRPGRAGAQGAEGNGGTMLRKWENLRVRILAKSIGKTTETRDKAAQTTVLFPLFH